ncbi:MAG: hypothetical protein ACOC8E_00695 [Planctomycetota bacterium]
MIARLRSRVEALAAVLLAAAWLASPGTAAQKYIVADDIDQWRAEMFCGSPTVRHFLQGPKGEGAATGTMAFDRRGNAYVACGTFIQVVTPDGAARLLTGAPGLAGNTDGPPWKATFAGADDIASADDHTLYVADGANFTVRKIEKREDGVWHTTTIAGLPGKKGHRDGPGRQALFTTPFDSITIDEKGAVYVLDGNWLRKIEGGTVTTLNAGSGRKNGPLGQALFDRIMGGRHCLSSDGKGNLYVADRWGMAVRKVDLDKKMVTTIAGVRPGEEKGRPTDGPALEARFHPGGGPVAVFANPMHDRIIVRSADEGGRIRQIKDGWVKTFGPGPGRHEALVGPWRDVRGGSPCGVDAQGNVYVRGSRCIRVIKKREGDR